jgi:hypothetical protein
MAGEGEAAAVMGATSKVEADDATGVDGSLHASYMSQQRGQKQPE